MLKTEKIFALPLQHLASLKHVQAMLTSLKSTYSYKKPVPILMGVVLASS